MKILFYKGNKVEKCMSLGKDVPYQNKVLKISIIFLTWPMEKDLLRGEKGSGNFFLLEMLVYLFCFIIFQQPIVMNPDLFLGEHYVAEFYDCEFKCLDDPT